MKRAKVFLKDVAPQVFEEIDRGATQQLKEKPIVFDALGVCSTEKVIWQCKKAGHRWTTTIGSRMRNPARPSPCRFCENEDKAKQQQSRADPSRVKLCEEEWHGTIPFSQCRIYSSQNAKWKCKICGHSWEARVYSRLFRNNNCARCYIVPGSRNELLCESALNDLGLTPFFRNHPIGAYHIAPLLVDFYIPANIVTYMPVAIEIDGEQHFKGDNVRDQIKNRYCKENGIHLLRISFSVRADYRMLIADFCETLQSLSPLVALHRFIGQEYHQN